MRALWLALCLCVLSSIGRAQGSPRDELQLDSVAGRVISGESGLRLGWEGEAAPGLLWSLSLIADGERILRLLAADGIDRNRMGWRPDRNPRAGVLEIRLDALWLAPGQYTVQIDTPDGHRQLFELWIEPPTSPSAREVTIEIPEAVSAISGWMENPLGGHDAFAWWPVVVPDRANITIDDRTWLLLAAGNSPTTETRVGPDRDNVRILAETERLDPRPLSVDRNSWMWGGAIPLCFLFVVFAFAGLWRGRNSEGLQAGIVLSIGMGLLILQPVITDPGAFLLDSGSSDNAVSTSIARLAIMASALDGWGGHGSAFSWPDGTPWLTGQPGWIGYLVPACIAKFTDPVTAHNLGIGLGTTLLCFFSWSLLRTLGASQAGSWMGATAACLSPAILEPLDQQGLDQSMLFLIPLFCLQLHNTATRDEWLSPLLAGATLAALGYCHENYGTILFLMAPLMVAWRLPGPNLRKRCARMAVLFVTALLLAIPGRILEHLETTQGSGREPVVHLVDTESNIANPFEDRTSSMLLLRRVSDAEHDSDDLAREPMARLALTVNDSNRWSDFLRPKNDLPGGSWYWPLAILAVLLAKRRLETARSFADVLTPMLFSLGPFVLLQSGSVGPMLPYYAAWLWFPGIDQIQRMEHWVQVSAVLAPIPLALALEGWLEQVSALWARLLHFSRLRLLGARTRISPALFLNRLVEPFVWQFKYAVYAPVLVFTVAVIAGLCLAIERGDVELPSDREGSATRTEAWVAPWPDIRAVPRHAALSGVPPGAALALPLMAETSADIHIPLIRAGIRLVNPAPSPLYPSTTRSWADTNPLVNHLAAVSASDGPTRFLNYNPSSVSSYVDDLLQNELDYLIMYRPQMPSPEVAAETERVLDELFPRVKDDGRFAIWTVVPPEDAP